VPKKSKVLTSVYHLALYLTIKRALRARDGFDQDGDGIVQLDAPLGVDADDYMAPLARYLYGGQNERMLDDVAFLIINTGDKQRVILSAFDDKIEEARRAVIVRENGAEVPTRLSLAVDQVIALQPISPIDLRIACRRNLQMSISEAQAKQALAHPPALLWAALRRGRSIEDVLARLSNTGPVIEVEERRAAPDVPPLSMMHGYGVAKTWGLDLAQDLRDWKKGKIDWSQVDQGIVLSGPPGVGKTIFARAVANECDVPIIAGSLGFWQSTGHLGDLLRAMRKDFGRAKESAPCILFIDELDAFGDRNSFTHDHKDYSIQVVNAFLELLDGLDGREGVVVIGATNNLSRIDPAILRSGRLDRHIEIGLPDREDRLAILDQQIGGNISRTDLEAVAGATRDFTGADLAKIVRDAGRRARRERRELTVADLHLALPEMVPITGHHRRAFAVHEAGHTVAILRLRHGVYHGTMIIDQARNDSTKERGGAALFHLPSIEYRNSQFYRNHILVNLAGIAAEEVILGSISDGAGAGSNSDLAVATRVATYMQTAMGMGSRLRHSLAREDDDLEKLRHADPTVSKWVDEVLATEFTRAKQLIRDNKFFVEQLADMLFETGRVTPEAAAMLDPEKTAEQSHIDAA
jgi:ATP-dependent Zn protease